LIRVFWSKLLVFLEMIKFEHSVFALPFAYAGLFLASNGLPSMRHFFWVTIAMVSFRTLSMALNRVIDKQIDTANPRTQARALPQGHLSESFVWIVILLSWIIFAVSAYKLNALCLVLSVIPILLTIVYPFMKRFSFMSHFVLGLILGIAPYGAWIAVREGFSLIPTALTLGVMFWVAGFDMIYALQDMKFDRLQGLHSFPAKFGEAKTLLATRVLHGLSVLCWAVAGLGGGLGIIFWVGMGIVFLFLVREHWIIRSYGKAKMNEAFFGMNAIVSVVLFIAVGLDVII